jgi:hypothetical protein
MEEAILAQLELGDISPEAKAALEATISEIVASKLIFACASSFSELEMSRMEHLYSEKDAKVLQDEIMSHIPDPDALLVRIANETIQELRENMVAIGN